MLETLKPKKKAQRKAKQTKFVKFFILGRLPLSVGSGLMPGSFRAYMEGIRAETGKTPDDYWNLANQKGFIKDGKVVVKHGDMLKWLKTDIGLGHVRANFVILYLRLRANDPTVTDQSKKWAYETGYKEYLP